MPEPLVSIFLPTHARFKNGLLQKSVESVLAQNHKNFEFFIVDDASSDGTEGYLKKIAQEDKRVHLIRHDKNVGLLALTLAQAYLQAKGAFIAFAFDDTEWHPRHLQMLLSCLGNNSSASMAYGGVVVQPPGAKPRLLGSSGFDLKRLTEHNYLGHSGVMLRRNTIDQIGWLDPNILVKRTCDWDLWMRIGKKLPVVHLPDMVAVEKGVVQPDSLGMSVTWYDSLTRKYQQTERDHLLAPDLVAQKKVPIFETLSWMNNEEIYQLQLLSFEHFIRTRELMRAVEITREWFKNSPVLENNDSKFMDIDLLIESFNLYLTETQYACKNTCSSAFKLHDLNHTHKLLEQQYTQLLNDNNELTKEYGQLENKYQRIVHSLIWRITKPIRELRKISQHN